MKKVILGICILLVSCSKNYIVGGKINPSNKVNETTFQFLESCPVTTETAKLIQRAGLIDEVNGDVTIIAPSNYAVDRYLRRKNNRGLRLNPDTTLMTVDTIPVDTLQQLKMYIVDGKWWSKTIPGGGIILPTHEKGDTILLYIDSTSNTEPGSTWDGGGVPGQGFQYSNFLSTKPRKVMVHFKRGEFWETEQQMQSLGLDDPECDQIYEMYLSDVITTTGVVHIIYAGDYDFSDHYYYHTLFFFGTRADDLL